MVDFPAAEPIPPNASADLLAVLESAADLQQLVPDAVLVGGSAAALYAGHRASYDHDHVLMDLRDRYQAVLDALEDEGEWVTNRVVPGKLVLGQIGEIEAGVRQLIRTVPLEVTQVSLPSGKILTVPTEAETLRIKAFLIVKRNQVRDYLDVAALAFRYGIEQSARVLVSIDNYYTDPDSDGTPVADQLIRQLSSPAPKDVRTIGQLPRYKALEPRWHNWSNVEEVLTSLAQQMLEEGANNGG